MRSWIVVLAVIACSVVTQATAAPRRSGPRLDRTFGRDGSVVLCAPSAVNPTRSFVPNWELVNGVADPSGRAYVLWGGAGPASLVLAAYDAEGRLDRAFGDDGVLALGALGGHDIILDSAGRVLVLGNLDSRDPDSPGAVVLRVLPDGSLDPAFGFGGVQRRSSPGLYPLDIHSDDSGGVLVLETDYSGLYVLFRLGPDGMLDHGYGDDGVAVVPRIGEFGISAHTVDTTGRFVAVDRFDADGDGLPAQYALVGLDSSGRPDSALPDQGTRVLDFGVERRYPLDVAVDELGRYVILGGGTDSTFIARYLSDGTPDATWSGTSDGVREVLTDSALRDTNLLSLTIDGTSYYADGIRSRHRRGTPPATVVVRVDEAAEQVWTSRFHSFRNNGSGLDVLSVHDGTVLAWSYLFGRRRPRRLNASLVRLRFD